MLSTIDLEENNYTKVYKKKIAPLLFHSDSDAILIFN